MNQSVLQSVTKIFLLTVCFSLFLSSFVFAKTVTLAWDPSPDANISGYKVYYNADSSSLPLNGSGASEGASPVDVGTALSSTLTNLPNDKIHYLAVTAYDTSGSESAYSNIVTSAVVIDTINRAPILGAIGSKNVNEGASLNFTINASDPDGNSLSYYASGLPSGAIFNAATRTFNWVPNINQAGNYIVTFTVTDGKLNDSEMVAINVSNMNQAPVISPIGNKIVNEGTRLSFSVSAIDPDSNSLVYSAANLPSGATFDTTTGAFSWTPTNTQSGRYALNFIVSDGKLQDSVPVIITVTNVNQAPVLANLYPQNITEGSTLNFTISGSDPDGDNLSYGASNLPSGAIFSGSSRAFVWKPSSSQSGSYSVTFSVSDGSLSDSQTILINVADNQGMDSDGDGVVDSLDAFPNDSSEWIDSDLDGVGNNADSDDDNDGIDDVADSSPLDPTVNAWIISATMSDGGSISPAGDSLLDYGGSQLYSIRPDSGYYLSDVYVDGNSVGAVGEYAFVAVDSHHNIDAQFLPTTDGLSLVPGEAGLPGVDRVDGGDDSHNFVDGDPKGDLDYIFHVVLQDASGAELPQVVLSLNGYAYQMTQAAGDVASGATYTFTTRLGPAAHQSFHFETRDSYGNLLTRLPEDSELQGPQVELLNGKNIVGVPGNVAFEQLSSIEALGSTLSYRWIPSEKRNGSYARVDNGEPVASGEGYVIKRTSERFLPSVDVYGENPEPMHEIPIKSGWNLIANPYGGNVLLSEVLVQDSGSAAMTWSDAVNNQHVVDGIYYYAGRDWGNKNIFEESGGLRGAVMIPRVGYWIYVNSPSESISLVIPKPQQ